MHAIRVVKIDKGDIVQLNGPASADRVLSNDQSENPVRLMDLGEPADGLHLGFESQLIYNQKSGLSLFLGALSEDKLLTGFHLLSTVGTDAHMLSYEVADTGTDTATGDQSKKFSSGHPDPFRVQVPAGTSISSERLMFAIGSDYHAQLESYGRAIRILHKALAITPSPMGWWSWTAYYYGVSQNTCSPIASGWRKISNRWGTNTALWMRATSMRVESTPLRMHICSHKASDMWAIRWTTRDSSLDCG